MITKATVTVDPISYRNRIDIVPPPFDMVRSTSRPMAVNIFFTMEDEDMPKLREALKILGVEYR